MRVPFYYDYACPWAYLGSCRVEPYFKDIDAEIDFRPIVLADVKEPTAGQRPEYGDRKKRYFAADIRQWAECVGADFSLDAFKNRYDTRLLLRAALVAADEGRFREYHYPAFRARWAEVLDVSDADVVGDLLKRAGLDPAEALERAQSDTIGRRLKDETDRAIELGVFGVPTLAVGERLFWGNDRFELAHYFLRKEERP
jgi:2-hydroxychromene-2-carboxylate isomerase